MKSIPLTQSILTFLLSSCLLSFSAYAQNVGIGTASPSSKLHVYSTTNTFLTIDNSSSTLQSGIQLSSSGSTKSNIYFDPTSGTFGANGALLINNVGTSSPHTLFNPSGTGGVGIGVNGVPLSILHIKTSGNTFATIDAASTKQSGFNMAIAGTTKSNLYYDNNTTTYGSNGALLINDVGAGSPNTLINPTSGGVGIGLGAGASPTQVLDAAGTPRFRGLTAGVVTSSSTGVVGSLAGTATTVLHGNASGTPTFSAVALGSDVSGTLGLVNGGTGANLSATGGTGQYLKQTTAGGAISVGTIAAADIPAGSGNYIQNTTTQQSSSNFNISGSGTVGTAINVGSTGSTFSNDQGGSLEVGSSNSVANTTNATPYLDFHYGVGSVQDYNVRVINDANGVLDIIGTEKVSTLAGTGTRAVMADATGILRANNKATTTTASWTTATAGTSWVVPAGVYQVNVLVIGGGGGSGYYCCSTNVGSGGAGGAVLGILPVTPGETLTIVVGGGGSAGGNNGGGGTGSSIKRGSTILCAGGGGGGGSYNSSSDWGNPGGTAFGTSLNGVAATGGAGHAAGGNNNIDYLIHPISLLGGYGSTGNAYNYEAQFVYLQTGVNGANYGLGGRGSYGDAGTVGAVFINY